MNTKDHSPYTGPLPWIPLPLLTRSPAQLPVQPLCSAQTSSHSEKKRLKSTQNGGGREREGAENALEIWLIKKSKKTDRVLADCEGVTV